MFFADFRYFRKVSPVRIIYPMDTTYTDEEMRKNLEGSGFAESELEALALLKDHLGIVLSVSNGALYMGRIDGDSDGLPHDFRKIGFIYNRVPMLFGYPRFNFPGLHLLVKRYYGIDIPQFKSTAELRMKLELRGMQVENPL